MATWKGRQPGVDAGNGLPADLLAGPDVTVWAPGEVSVPEWSDHTPEQHRRSTAWHAWSAAGAEWGKRQGLPANQRWTELLPPELHYITKALGRAHVVAGGLQAPWQPRTST